MKIPMTGTTVRIGTFAFSVRLPAAERNLAQEILDLYTCYPGVGSDDFADFVITLNYPNVWQRFAERKIQVFLDGVPPYEPWPPELGVPMLESAINSWMGKNVARFLLIHAGAVERDGDVILLPGASGAGKSTLSVVLASRGWRLLSDEIAMVRPTDGLVIPHPRPITLKNTSIDMIAERLPEAQFTKRYEGTTKGTVAFVRPPGDAIKRALEPAKPAVVVFPRYNPDGRPKLKRLEKARAFLELVANTPHYGTHLETGFETLATLVEACDHYSLSYSSIDDAISLLENLRQ